MTRVAWVSIWRIIVGVAGVARVFKRMMIILETCKKKYFRCLTNSASYSKVKASNKKSIDDDAIFKGIEI
jgi:hypothetical protein